MGRQVRMLITYPRELGPLLYRTFPDFILELGPLDIKHIVLIFPSQGHLL